MNFDNVDKTLITEGTLYFTNGTDSQHLTLADDGLVEVYHNDVLKNTFPFSKVGLIRECKTLTLNNYTLTKITEAEIPTNNTNKDTDNVAIDMNNPEKTKQELQQDIKNVEEIQNLKNELDDKVDELMEESTLPTEPFPSTDFTKEPMTLKEITLDNFNNNLTVEQKTYINVNIGTIDDLVQAMINLYNEMGCKNSALLSLDEYVEELIQFNNMTESTTFDVTDILSESKLKFYSINKAYDIFMKTARDEAEGDEYTFKLSDIGLTKEESAEFKSLLLKKVEDKEDISSIEYDPLTNLYTITLVNNSNTDKSDSTENQDTEVDNTENQDVNGGN